MEFCTSCHEMESTVYQEYQQSVHWTSRSGVRPTCANCHVPHESWIKTVVAKTFATKELFGHIAGTIDTQEKFDAKRLELAEHVWARMKATNSEACRSCHKVEAWDFAAQKPRSVAQHQDALKTGETCIDCHKGIAHKDVSKELEPQQNEEEDFSLE